MEDWLEINRLNWDERADAHAASPDYAVERFVADPAYLSEVVRFDLPRLGDVTGLRGVHLQCHIGTDTLSLHRLGARMTGLDFSAPAIAQARALAERTGADIDYVQAEFSRALEVLEPGSFDLVFTGIGALCWLPSAEEWATIVAALLKPGGRLFIREGHPILWALNDTRSDGLLVIDYPYFEQPEPLMFEEEGSYVETEGGFAHNRSAYFPHGLGEIVTAVLGAGMELTMLVEHDSVPWNPLEQHDTERVGESEWRVRDRPERIPASYTLQAVKR
ncbi:MAG: class I SAM-dependent methyltransferase [Solirubrobacteraceae bacterium]|nr:class I SAM-dependent methyltransferase [Solirubrobacteraceae bacterium]